jgi:hypothetical protein
MVSTTGLKILLLLVGFVWWSIAFVALYSTQSIGCGLQWHLDPSLGGLSFLRVLLIGLFAMFCVVGVAICLGFVWLLRRRRGEGEDAPSRFLETSGALAAYAAAVATLMTFAPILYASPCT